MLLTSIEKQSHICHNQWSSHERILDLVVDVSILQSLQYIKWGHVPVNIPFQSMHCNLSSLYSCLEH